MELNTPKTFWRKNFKNLSLKPQVGDLPPSTQQFAPEAESLMVGIEVQLRLDKTDLAHVAELGHGNGGTVTKVTHVPTGIVMAKKVIYLETNPKVQKSIQTELETLKKCDSECIVKYYGQFVEAKSVTFCMEYMDCGSLDKIYKQVGPLPEPIIAGVSAAVVDGLIYLKKHLSITHRDVKPSNILVNSRGEIKLCDFGVSGELINSIAETFVGTSTYMSPERISGEAYSSAGDVWSLGLTLVELARGGFPFQVDNVGTPFSIFELLQRIVNEPPPKLPDGCSAAFVEFVDRCLQLKPDRRMRLRELADNSFYSGGKQSQALLAAWAAKLPVH